MSYFLRNAKLADADSLAELWTLAGIEFDRVLVDEELSAVLGLHPSLVIVAQNQAGPVGAVMGTFDGRRALVNRLAVAPEHQGEGIGKALIAELEMALRELGARKLNLLIEPSNNGVVPFYRMLGYAEDELIFMEKFLA